MKDVDGVAILKPSPLVSFCDLHLKSDVVHIEISSESVSNAVDGVVDHEFILLGKMLLLVISWHCLAHVVLHQVHRVNLLAINTPFAHLQHGKWAELPSPSFISVLHVCDVLSHFPGFPMCSWGTLSLLLYHRSDMGHVPYGSIGVVLEGLLELMNESFMIEH